MLDGMDGINDRMSGWVEPGPENPLLLNPPGTIRGKVDGRLAHYLQLSK